MIRETYTKIEWDTDRLTCAWVVTDTVENLTHYAPSLFRAHQDLQDWIIQLRPLLIFPVDTPSETGMIFEDVQVISPEKIPSKCFALCLNHSLAKLIMPAENPTESIINYNQIFADGQIRDWFNNESLIIGGVVCPQP